MRIAYLHGGSIPSVYANGVHVMRMCDALCEAGHTVSLHALPGSIPSADPHAYYGVRHRFRLCPQPASRLPRLGPWLRARRVRDAVLREGGVDLGYGRDVRSLLAVSDHLPVVYETHLLWEDRGIRACERRLFRSPALRRVVFVTRALAADYAAAFPELASLDVVVAPDAADPPGAELPPPADLGGRPEALAIGYVGHLYPGRGTEVILELARRLPEMDFHLVGGTPQDLARWRARVATGNVHVHGHVPPGEVGRWYPRFDIVLAPYQRRVAMAGGTGDIARWTSPMKLFEYMAHGRPVVASDLPVLRELLVDRVNCVLCPAADVDAWERAVGELAADPGLRASLGEKARAEIREEHTWRRRVDRVLPVADSLSMAQRDSIRLRR